MAKTKYQQFLWDLAQKVAIDNDTGMSFAERWVKRFLPFIEAWHNAGKSDIDLVRAINASLGRHHVALHDTQRLGEVLAEHVAPGTWTLRLGRQTLRHVSTVDAEDAIEHYLIHGRLPSPRSFATSLPRRR